MSTAYELSGGPRTVLEFINVSGAWRIRSVPSTRIDAHMSQPGGRIAEPEASVFRLSNCKDAITVAPDRAHNDNLRLLILPGPLLAQFMVRVDSGICPVI